MFERKQRISSFIRIFNGNKHGNNLYIFNKQTNVKNNKENYYPPFGLKKRKTGEEKYYTSFGKVT